MHWYNTITSLAGGSSRKASRMHGTAHMSAERRPLLENVAQSCDDLLVSIYVPPANKLLAVGAQCDMEDRSHELA
jgi:hypothetical protein